MAIRFDGRQSATHAPGADRISSMILDLNLAYGTNLSELIVDRETWDHGIPSALPIHKIIEEEGVSL